MQWAERERKTTLYDTIVRMKQSDGRVIHQDRYKPRILDELTEMNLLGKCPHTGRLFQRTWKEIHIILGIKTMTFVTVTHRVLNKYSAKDIRYAACLQYMLRLQEDGGTLIGKPSEKGAHIQLSVHNGGIAHSLMMAFFKRSLKWSQSRRVSCNNRGLIIFERRTAKATEFGATECLPETEGHYRSFDITSKSIIRVRFSFSVPRWARGELQVKKFDVKQGCYVYPKLHEFYG
jgi:hypothetical protein